MSVSTSPTTPLTNQQMWAEMDLLNATTIPVAADPNCSSCGHGKGMHMSFGGCSYRDPSTGDCRCTVRRSDIR